MHEKIQKKFLYMYLFPHKEISFLLVMLKLHNLLRTSEFNTIKLSKFYISEMYKV